MVDDLAVGASLSRVGGFSFSAPHPPILLFIFSTCLVDFGT